jgi:hypothetical protein
MFGMTDQRLCMDRATMDQYLPRDVLERIMGFRDRKTLCTLRLVNKAFCAAASAHIRSLTLTLKYQHDSIHRFPLLEHVTLDSQGREVSLVQLAPDVCDLITTVRLSEPPLGTFMMETLPRLNVLRNLRELELSFVVKSAPESLCHCTSLEVLKLKKCTFHVARTIMTLTSLTALHIGRVSENATVEEDENFSWLELATSLRKLQALESCGRATSDC